MKKISLTKTSGFLITMIGMGVMIGCGGGSSSSSSSGGSTSSGGANPATLDTRNVNLLGQNAAQLIPGCVYNSNSVSTVLNDHNIKAYRAVYSSIIKPKKNTRDVGDTGPVPGSCGGTMQQSGSGTNMQYQFNNYCTGDENTKVTLNGSIQVSMVQQGETIKSVSASTGSAGLTAITVENGTTSTEKLYLNGFKYTDGDPSTLTINELKIDSTEDGTYRVTDVNIVQKGDEETGTVQIVSATYYDPEVGAVTVSTSEIPMSDDATGSASITITSQGQTATFTADDANTPVFKVSANGQQVGTLDCTVALTQIEGE